jgi:hypothetical protein
MKRRALLSLLGLAPAAVPVAIATAAPAAAKPLPMWVEEETGADGEVTHLRLKARCINGAVVTIVRWSSNDIRKTVDWIGLDVGFMDHFDHTLVPFGTPSPID